MVEIFDISNLDYLSFSIYSLEYPRYRGKKTEFGKSDFVASEIQFLCGMWCLCPINHDNICIFETRK